jgi:hypothetical protein
LSETGPGNRDFNDFVDGKVPNADRRRQYLSVVTELLIDDLNTLVKAWRPGSKLNYRARFETEGNEALRKMFVAMGSLSRGELAGERLEVALNSQDQEDEHSCFSDNTHRDAVLNATGIENVWLGRYKRADGPCCKARRRVIWWLRKMPRWRSAPVRRSPIRWQKPAPSRRRSTVKSSAPRTPPAASASRPPSTAWCSRARIWSPPRMPSALPS